MSNKHVPLHVSDGTTMSAYVARPSTPGRHPGLMLFQEAFGVNAHIRDLAERFAKAGYVTIAPELFHRTAPGFEGSYTDFESTRPHVGALTPAGLEADIHASFEWLKGDSGTDPASVFSTGYCMGGRVSFIANSILPVRAAASFYGGGIAPGNLERVPRLNGPMLFFWAGRDRHIGPDTISAVTGALRAAGKPFVNVEISDADHGFFCDARAAYNKAAATQAWGLLLTFFNQNGGAEIASLRSQ